MKRFAQLISLIGLSLTIVPACVFFSGGMDLDATKLWMLTGAVVWFATAPLWMEHKAS